MKETMCIYRINQCNKILAMYSHLHKINLKASLSSIGFVFRPTSTTLFNNSTLELYFYLCLDLIVFLRYVISDFSSFK